MSDIDKLKQEVLNDLKKYLDEKDYVTREELSVVIGKLEAFNTQYMEIKDLVIESRNDVNNLGGKIATDFGKLTSTISDFTVALNTVENDVKKGFVMRTFDNSPKLVKFVITFIGMWLLWVFGTSLLPQHGNDFMEKYGLWVLLFNTMISITSSRINSK